MTIVATPSVVVDLVERFLQDASAYKSSAYNEAQARRELIEPLFTALGWDLDNRSGRPEPFKDVIHEDSIKVGGATKAPDYCFKIGGKRQFFLEAKRPSVNIAEAASPAFQLRRYAWSAQLPVSVLCDFEELAVYDCRSEPHLDDGPEVGRSLLLRYTDYVANWSSLASLLSRDAVAHGALEAYAAANRQRKGEVQVDRAFLRTIESWRSMLAVDLAQRNRSLTTRELNFAVQIIIDRIVFLRICEDRGIEEYGALGRAGEKPDVYHALRRVFEDADARYNSGLFHFSNEPGRHEHPDRLTPNLAIGDEVLRNILSGLYFPRSLYAFSVLPAEILGHVYEQFLGRVIRLTVDHEAIVEERPEVRKAGGVYYTPSYIANYIVEVTVGKLLASHKPRRRWAPPILRIVDPACGSGSFLIVAYQVLLDWYLTSYLADGADKHKRRLYRAAAGDYRLTSAQRKEILLRHIFGVDVDSQAVETTKLSLLLKVLEHESSETIGQNLTLYRERALPDLGVNIKCGNALVGKDFVNAAQMTLLNEEMMLAVNPFDWETEFPDVFHEDVGGFDVVLGNPPYLSYSGRQATELAPPLREYLFSTFDARGWPTAHGFFIEQSIRRLSRRYVAFIVPAQVGHLEGYASAREALSRKGHVNEVVYWGEEVFADVVTPALTFVADRTGEGNTSIRREDGSTSEMKLACGAAWSSNLATGLLERLSQISFFLGEAVADPGVHTGNVSKKVIFDADVAPPGCVPVLEGKQVGRYRCDRPRKALFLEYERQPDEYFTVRPEQRYLRSSFVIRQTAAYPIVGPRRHGTYFRNTLLALYPTSQADGRFVVGVLNSKLLRCLYQGMVADSGQKAFPQVKVRALRKLPIRKLDRGIESERQSHDSVVELVDLLVELTQRGQSANTQREAEGLARQVGALDEQLDRLIYEIYDLSEQEIAQVEAATSR